MSTVKPAPTEFPAAALPPGAVRRAGLWTVANRDGDLRAVSSRCRHQLADLSKGSLDAKGCLVCPWHGSRYDLDTGAMVSGPRGFLWYVGKAPGYSGFVKAVGTVVRLRRAAVTRFGDTLRVGSLGPRPRRPEPDDPARRGSEPGLPGDFGG